MKSGCLLRDGGLFESFREKGVHVATVTAAGFVDAKAVGEQFWAFRSQRSGSWEVEAVYAPG